MSIPAQIADLFVRYLGGEWCEADLQEMIDSEDCYVTYRAEDGRVYAAASARLCLDDECDEYGVPYGSGFLESAVVEPELRGLGIGQSMLDERLQWLRSLEVTTVVALCWLSGLVFTSLPLLEKAGFSVVRVLERPWVSESCPLCGESCQCDAALVRLDHAVDVLDDIDRVAHSDSVK